MKKRIMRSWDSPTQNFGFLLRAWVDILLRFGNLASEFDP
jgi:urea transporter